MNKTKSFIYTFKKEIISTTHTMINLQHIVCDFFAGLLRIRGKPGLLVY